MSNAKIKSTKASKITPSMTAVLGTRPILPGESAEEYQQGLNALIEELDAKTVMQAYVAEKIFECLWWMRRYEQQKRVTLAREMARILFSGSSHQLTSNEANILEHLLNSDLYNEFEKWLAKSSVHYTVQSLQQAAFSNKSSSLSAYNEQITVLAKTLSGFQASYEVLANRKLNMERLRMQNELLAKDLKAIDVESLPDASQPQKKSRK